MKVELNNKLCAVENEKCPDTWRVSRRNDLIAQHSLIYFTLIIISVFVAIYKHLYNINGEKLSLCVRIRSPFYGRNWRKII